MCIGHYYLFAQDFVELGNTFQNIQGYVCSINKYDIYFAATLICNL